MVTAYGLGLPELPRTAGRALVTSVIAAISGAVVISVLQLVTGDALLPRFVVFGSAIVLVPWYLFCAALAVGGRQRDAARDRAARGRSATRPRHCASTSVGAPERSASVAGVVLPESVTQPTGTPRADGPLVERVAELSATVVVLERGGRGRRLRHRSGRRPPLAGACACARSLVLRGVAGEAAAGRPRAGLADVRHRRGPPGPLRPREAPRSTSPSPWSAWSCSSSSCPSWCSATSSPTAVRCSIGQERVGKGGAAFRSSSSAPWSPPAPRVGDWTDRDRRPADHPVRAVPAQDATSTSCPRLVNILRGDLSIVGPRPEQPHYVEAELGDALPVLRPAPPRAARLTGGRR